MKPKRKPLNITISPVVREALDAYATDHGQSASRVIEDLLRAMLKAEGWLNIKPPCEREPHTDIALAADQAPVRYGKRRSA